MFSGSSVPSRHWQFRVFGSFFRASRRSCPKFGWNRELKDEPPSGAGLAHRRRLFALPSSVLVTLCDCPFGRSQVYFLPKLRREFYILYVQYYFTNVYIAICLGTFI